MRASTPGVGDHRVQLYVEPPDDFRGCSARLAATQQMTAPDRSGPIRHFEAHRKRGDGTTYFPIRKSSRKVFGGGGGVLGDEAVRAGGGTGGCGGGGSPKSEPSPAGCCSSGCAAEVGLRAEGGGSSPPLRPQPVSTNPAASVAMIPSRPHQTYLSTHPSDRPVSYQKFGAGRTQSEPLAIMDVFAWMFWPNVLQTYAPVSSLILCHCDGRADRPSGKPR
jgi:hypothetical protein